MKDPRHQAILEGKGLLAGRPTTQIRTRALQHRIRSTERFIAAPGSLKLNISLTNKDI
jgi:hypothetical protein